jgi:uncharacterized protein (TIGR04168 family)
VRLVKLISSCYEPVRVVDLLPKTLKIAIVGDVHDQWNDLDASALQGLGVDLVLFVGDFGNEAVGIVRQVAALPLPKAVMLGNHDVWYSATQQGKAHCPYDRKTEDWVQLQLDLLGEDFVGFGYKDFPELGLSVVGSRPYSWGGANWKHNRFYQQRCQVSRFEQSTQRIVQAMQSTAFDTVIMLGHNGPAGLGEASEAICGKDWGDQAGDHGDPDLAAAIEKGQMLGKRIPLVTFGHMHHRLRHRRDRERQIYHFAPPETLYLNTACVPRIQPIGGEELHNFTLVDLGSSPTQPAIVQQSSLVWVNGDGVVRSQRMTYRAL